MPNFSQSNGFKMNMGSKQKETEGSFSEDDTTLLKMTPIYRALVGNQPNLPINIQKAILADKPKSSSETSTPIKAIQSKGVDGNAAYKDNTTDSVAEAMEKSKKDKEEDKEKIKKVGQAIAGTS